MMDRKKKDKYDSVPAEQRQELVEQNQRIEQEIKDRQEQAYREMHQ